MKIKIGHKHHTPKRLSWLISNQVERNPDIPKEMPKPKYVYRRQTIPSNAEDYFTKVIEEYVKQLADKNNEIGSKIISNSIQI